MAKAFNPLPAPGDILWCHFPRQIGEPGPKPRPALVLAVSHSTHQVQVAYGTSQKTDRLYPGEFVMDPSDAGFPASGLSFRTKFDLAHHEKIPFDSDWFKQAPGIYATSPLPKMGIVHPSYFKAAKKANDEAAKL